uniref:Nedd4 family interacting protein 2 n=1 Tax=Anas platyrhynchos platyrhynchos TaxID=8840 RepID=A0A493T2D0_ANAPP
MPTKDTPRRCPAACKGSPAAAGPPLGAATTPQSHTHPPPLPPHRSLSGRSPAHARHGGGAGPRLRGLRPGRGQGRAVPGRRRRRLRWGGEGKGRGRDGDRGGGGPARHGKGRVGLGRWGRRSGQHGAPPARQPIPSVAFIFNWIGFCLSFCITNTIAGRYGAICGFGLSLIKWILIVRFSDYFTGYFNGQYWLWWIFLVLGLLLFFRGFVNYLKVRNMSESMAAAHRTRFFFLY